MRTLAIPIAMATGAALIGAAPATAENRFAPATFRNIANVFTAADLDRNGSLSSREYVMLRNGSIDQSWLASYRGDAFDRMVPTIVRNFALLDTDNNGALSQVEFMNLTKASMRQRVMTGDPYRWDWTPEYMSVNYYLTANPIDADHFDGKQVVNLQGQEIGRVRNIVRHEDSGRTYALIDVADRVMDPTPTHVRARVIGVPLNEVVLSTENAALMLTRRGEEYFLSNEGRPRVDIGQLREIETLYGV